jgi:LPS sulfotransferase NodH
MKCIFIGGADRSGTTLLASLLSCIEGSVVTPESLFKTEITFEEPINTIEYSKKLNLNPNFKRWNVDLSNLNNIKHKDYKEYYSNLLCQYKPDKKIRYWIDHTPNNLRYSRQLNDVFDDCFFIHIVRDGRAVANSQISLEWGANTFLAAAKDWMNKLLYGAVTENLFPTRTISIRYEDLLDDQSPTIKSILDFIGIKETNETKSIDSSFLPEFTKSQHSLVGKGPDRSRSMDWKSKLSTQNIADYQYYAGDILMQMGYELVDTKNTKVTKSHLVRETFKELWFKKVINPSRYIRNRR